MKKISVVIPTYNEEGNVGPISEQLVKQFDEALPEYDYEIIFIDNDSSDNTRPLLRSICEKNPKIKAIFNAKNYGQFNSPFHGLLQATGDCIIGMVADFQDPVELIPQYVHEWENGYKIVLGQKTSSKENRIIRRLRTVYYRFMKKHASVEFMEQVTGSGLFDRSFVEVLRQVDEPRPFIRGLICEMGYNIKLIPYEQPKRKSGKSHNNVFTLYDATMQSLTAYTKTGVRVAELLGLICFFLGIGITVGMFIYKLLNWSTYSITGYLLPLAILIIGSLNMFFIGFVGEYVMDANTRLRNRPLVVEKERINFEKE